MNSLLRIALVALALGLGVWAYTAGNTPQPEVAAAGPHAAAPTTAPAPTGERLQQRSNERWAAIARGDWIEAFNYLSPEQRRALNIAEYLSGKNLHQYNNPVVERLVHSDAVDGYLQVRVLWTPLHPEVRRALEPGQSVTEELHMYETWRWAGDDWYFVLGERADEFRVKHPDLDVR